MDNNKDKYYTVDNEQLARFAKAMGHPARITILHFVILKVTESVTIEKKISHRLTGK